MHENRKEPLDVLAQIHSVDAPPFLWTRIQQKINIAQENRLAPAFAYLLGLSFLVLISLNVLIISQKTHHTPSKDNNIAQAMSLLPNNALYK